MSKITVYPSGGKNAKENKAPQVIDFEMETHACGRKNAGNEVKEFLYEAADKSNTGLLVVTAVTGHMFSLISDNVIENVKKTDRRTLTEENFENASNNVGGAAIMGGLGDCTATLAIGLLAVKGVKWLEKIYGNSPSAQKFITFCSKGVRRAADCVRLTENDTMHKGKYHHTIVPAKNGKMGHTYVNPVKKFMNRFREGY